MFREGPADSNGREGMISAGVCVTLGRRRAPANDRVNEGSHYELMFSCYM